MQIGFAIGSLLVFALGSKPYFDRIKSGFRSMLGDINNKDFNNVLLIVEMDGELEYVDGIKLPKAHRTNLKLSSKVEVNMNQDFNNPETLLKLKNRFLSTVIDDYCKTHPIPLVATDVYYIHRCYLKILLR